MIALDGTSDDNPGQVFLCWCGHAAGQHGPKTVDGIYRSDACLVCRGLRCDEVEWGTFSWVDLDKIEEYRAS